MKCPPAAMNSRAAAPNLFGNLICRIFDDDLIDSIFPLSIPWSRPLDRPPLFAGLIFAPPARPRHYEGSRALMRPEMRKQSIIMAFPNWDPPRHLTGGEGPKSKEEPVPKRSAKCRRAFASACFRIDVTPVRPPQSIKARRVITNASSFPIIHPHGQRD